MAGAIKHMYRSHRSYKTSKPFADFERKSQIKKERVENKSFFSNLFHRITNK